MLEDNSNKSMDVGRAWVPYSNGDDDNCRYDYSRV